MTDWIQLYATYRILVARRVEVVQGVLLPGLDGEHPAVRSVLQDWQGSYHLCEHPEGVQLTLVRRDGPQRRERWLLHVALFLLTLLTTSAAGAWLFGHEPFDLVFAPLGPVAIPIPAGIRPDALVSGLAFSLPLLGILLGHEMGHYLMARRRGMDVSPPYFIPTPHWLNLIGTFGAFIRMRSPMINRRILLDVGAGGPIASFVLSIPVLALGFAWSQVAPVPPGVAPASFVVFFGPEPLWLGGAPLFRGLAWLFAPHGGVLWLHPLAFAGWLGLFVTALNLFPLSQLDGGHILYALVGERQRWIGIGFLGLLLVLGWWWSGWWFWAALILLLGRGRVGHPSVLDAECPVVGVRRTIGWICIFIFLLTFVAQPLQL